MRLRDERGVALLSALLSVALLTLIVVEMTDSTLLHTHLARNAGNAMAAQLLARSAEVGAEAILMEDARQHSITANDGLWNIPFPPLPVGSGEVALSMDDEGGKLDLNLISNQRQREALDNLFKSLDLDPALLESVANWTEPAQKAGASGRSATSECALSIPCAPTQAKLRSLDDLRLIRGFNDQVIARLRPYVTALPEGAVGANVNTAPPQVLQALGCSVPQNFAAPFEGYKDLSAFKEDASCKADASAFRVRSDYFSITATGSVGDATQTVRALVKRSQNEAKRLTWLEQPVFDLAPTEVR